MSHCTWWPPSSLRPASFLFLGGWVWCRLTWHGQSLWRAPPACQPPGRSLNQGTERGTSATLRRGERSPRALSPCTAPPPCNPPFINNTPSTPSKLQTPLWGRLPEQRTLSSADRSFSIFTIMIWKSLLLDMQDIQPAVWFMEFTLTSNVAQNMAACRLWVLIRDGHDHSEDRFMFTLTSGIINNSGDVVFLI